MSQSPSTPIPQQEAGPIAHDVPCRKCGYNLRGLDPVGRCPECGAAIGYSVQGDLLRFMDPDWVDALGRGIHWVIWGVVVIAAGTVIGTVAAGATGEPRLLVLGAIAAIPGWILLFIGSWLVTWPDPSGLGEDQYGTARKLIRIALLVGILRRFLALSPFFMPPIDDNLETLVTILGFAVEAVAVIGIFAQLCYLQKITLRIPDPGLSRFAKFLMFAMGIPYFALVTLRVAEVVHRGPPGDIQWIAQGTLIAGLAILILGIVYIVMLEKIRRRFVEQAQIARATWAALSANGRPPPPPEPAGELGGVIGAARARTGYASTRLAGSVLRSASAPNDRIAQRGPRRI